MNHTEPMTIPRQPDQARGASPWLVWLPWLAVPSLTVWMSVAWPRWGLMWALALEIYVGCKLLTWWEWRALAAPLWRHLAYLAAWPGLDARSFLEPGVNLPRPGWTDWLMASVETAFGAFLFWGMARVVPLEAPLVAGWIGLFGLIFLLHFGAFQLIALAWQRLGVNAQPLMKMPVLSRSLAEFWGVRWNAAFNRIAHDLLFQRLHRRLGAAAATMVVFLVSGLIHDLVISVPARGGYGFPTAYFLLQGAGVLLERSLPGRALGLRRGFAGRVFTILVTAGPAFWLFHPAFVIRVIIPFMKAFHAI